MSASAAVIFLALVAPATCVRSSRAPGHAADAATAPMAQVQGELVQIRKEDTEHTQKLLFVVKLREALRMRLSAEDEKLAGSNAKVATKISEVMHGQHLQETATLLQKVARKSDRSAEDIAADALKHMQALSGLIDEIQGREDAEMSALVETEKKRRSIAGSIEAEQEAMSGDSATLMTDLGKIRSLLLSGGTPQAQPSKAQEAEGPSATAAAAPVPETAATEESSAADVALETEDH